MKSIKVTGNSPVKLDLVEPNQDIDLGTIKICTMPSYNVDKDFHPKDAHWLGFLIKMNGLLIYHAGDTDIIPEMQKLTGLI